MTEELIIDGRRVDMNADTKITLNFKSNLFGEISKITSSNSQTILLPKTNHNRNILDNPTSPSRPSDFPRRRHTAQYIRNGVVVIRDAYAVILDCSDKYEIALYWGEMTKFQSWVNSSAKLNDLSVDNIIQIWNYANTKPTGQTWRFDDGTIKFNDNDYLFYATYDTGIGSFYTMPTSARNTVAPLPFISAKLLLNKIQQDNGLTFEFPDGFLDNTHHGIFERVAVHLSSRKSSIPVLKSATISGLTDKKGEFKHQGGLLFTLPSSDAYTVQNKEIKVNIFGDKTTATHIKFNVAGRLKLYGFFAVGITVGKWEHDLPVHGFILTNVFKNGNEYIDYKQTTSNDRYVGRAGLKYAYDCACSLSLEMDVEKGDEIAIVFESEGKFYTFKNWSSPIWSESTLTVTPPAAEITISLGEYFRTKGNLPDIKQLDFVKALMSMFGLSVIPSGVANKLKFISLDTLLSNTSNAVDWSSKLIATGDGEPSKIKFTFGDYCRRNRFLYKSDDTVTATGAGEMMIDNDALDPEKDVVTLPFVASDETIVNPTTGESGAIVAHYKSEDGKISDVKVNPHVVMIMPDDADTGEALAKFTPISFSQLVGTYYQTLQRLLNSAIVITEKFRLSEFDLLALDYTKPVYLRQYGKYYGVISVQSSGAECTVELLQLPSNRGGVSAGVFYSTDGGKTYTATEPTKFDSVKVFSLGGTINNDDVARLSSAANVGATFDFSDAEFADETTGITFGRNNTESPLIDTAAKVILPTNVTVINGFCFVWCERMTEITLPPRLTEIRRNAFMSAGIQQIDIPATVDTLGNSAFYGCEQLRTIICRAADVPAADISTFEHTGDGVTGDKYVFVPDVAKYTANDNWSVLRQNGFVFRDLSEMDEFITNKIKAPENA